MKYHAAAGLRQRAGAPQPCVATTSYPAGTHEALRQGSARLCSPGTTSSTHASICKSGWKLAGR